MIVILKPDSSAEEVAVVSDYFREHDLPHHVIHGPKRIVIELHSALDPRMLAWMKEQPQVDEVASKSRPFLAAADAQAPGTVEIALNEHASVGGRKLAVIAGPCCVEDETQLMECAFAALESGAVGLRGGAFKPRTSPYSFQGLGEEGLELLARAGEATGLAVVTEVMSDEQVALVAKYADVLQVGSRNMHNYSLLAKVGRQEKPVLLKRGWSAPLDEFLFSAEYIMKEGNEKVVLCERGIRTFESHVRNTLALGIVPIIKQRSRLPIVVDPSHGMGARELVAPMSMAAVACGADGLLIEMHPRPDAAWSDSAQTISPRQLQTIMETLNRLAPVCDRVA